MGLTLPATGIPLTVYYRQFVNVTVTGTTGETTLASFTLPATVIGPNTCIRIRPFFSTTTNNANNKTIQVKFGAFSVLNSTSIVSSAHQERLIHVFMRNATNSQVSMLASQATGVGTAGTSVPPTGSVDCTSDVTILFTGQLATISDNITLEQYQIEILKT